MTKKIDSEIEHQYNKTYRIIKIDKTYLLKFSLIFKLQSYGNKLGCFFHLILRFSLYLVLQRRTQYAFEMLKYKLINFFQRLMQKAHYKWIFISYFLFFYFFLIINWILQHPIIILIRKVNKMTSISDELFFSTEEAVPQQSQKGKKVYDKWSELEKTKYRQFLEANSELFDSRFQRKSCKVFCLLEKHIETKTKLQCKSHHQKMMQRFKSIPNIINENICKQDLKAVNDTLQAQSIDDNSEQAFSDKSITITSFLQLNIHNQEKLGLFKRNQPCLRSIWSVLQRGKYIEFLKDNIQLFNDKFRRKSLKVFCLMQEVIKTKTKVQIKSFHQKMTKKYLNIDNIIYSQEREFQKPLNWDQKREQPFHSENWIDEIFQSSNQQEQRFEF